MPFSDRRQSLPAQAQTLTPDMLRPVPGGFVSPQDLPLRKLAVDDDPTDPTADDRLRIMAGAAMPTPRRRRGSGRFRNTACRRRAARPTPASTRSTAPKRSRRFIPARPSRSRPPVPAVRRPSRRRSTAPDICGCRCRRRHPPTSRRLRPAWPTRRRASRRARGWCRTPIRSARSAITPAAS